MSVPIATSPGRSGFGPQLALSYDSGAGNSPFGFGWGLSLPSVTRKTDKGLPHYLDAEESDVFLLAGSEDLVPILAEANMERVTQNLPPRTVGHRTYVIKRYRPRVEGMFARIERWTNQADPADTFWRSISKDNVTTWYGKNAESRIVDPSDATRVFSWLICESHDDKGNAIVYRYQAENAENVDLFQAHERNRGLKADPLRCVNRYLKRIFYGNRKPYLPTLLARAPWPAPPGADDDDGSVHWMFEVVCDYGEGHCTPRESGGDGGELVDASVAPSKKWIVRNDPFSSYRAGFEVRTYRLCHRVLMFHHFPGSENVDVRCLVRSTDFTYSSEQDPAAVRNPVYTFLQAVAQSGYRRHNGGYKKRSLPPVEFWYTQPAVQDALHEVDAENLVHLPGGVDGGAYQWTDLHGEGIPGILTEQAGAWFYKRNLSPIGKDMVEFAPLERVAARPNVALAGGQGQFMDLAGDGQPDLVVLDGLVPGMYEHDEAEGWNAFRPFTARLNRDLRDPNLKFVDLDGDGHADVLITEHDALVWHPSLGEAGFGPSQRVARALDDEQGPRLVFADGTESIYLADLSGDGLTDLVRIRNDEVCYWPNRGYGRFGAKVTMDRSPHFDNPDQFDHKRIRLADIDGSGTTDIIYLHRTGVRLYFNQSGNGWSAPQALNAFQGMDDVVSIVPTDLRGNGTACLVWSSPLPGDARRQMRYVDLMGGQKPHLLVRTVNNLGAETRVHYASSTTFYLRDKRDGIPWVTKLPFPVQVVERVETFDHVSRNRFVTRYAYHHGYFDGEEREFRGFGMVEQWDAEQFEVFGNATPPSGDNVSASSHVPPVRTRTWFHTGVYLGREHVSDCFTGEYFRDDEARPLLLPDTILPPGLTLDEEREACRALKGSMLRQEVYADDAGPESRPAQLERARTPYTVVEQNFRVRLVQARGPNRHAVFFTHPGETITFHYERDPVDPRIQHTLTLEVDGFGNVLKSATIGYGRRTADASLPTDDDRTQQKLMHITCTENTVTNALDAEADRYRTCLPAGTRTYELRKPEQEKRNNGPAQFHGFSQVLAYVRQAGDGLHDIACEDIAFEQARQAAANDPNEGDNYFRRLTAQARTLYRKDDLTALLPQGELEPLALSGATYKLAFTPGLLAQVYRRDGAALLPDPAAVLGGQGADRGGYVDLDGDHHWWVPTGRVFLSPDTSHTGAQELAFARQHFFLPHRTRDPFTAETFVTYDVHDLLPVETRDALGNRVTAGERAHVMPDGTVLPEKPGNDYRVLQPQRMMDPNRNRIQVAFDILGMVAGTAVMGKPEENLGDALDGFSADLAEPVALEHLAHPLTDPHAILGRATTRLVYDLFAYQRTKHLPEPQASVAYTLARETHDADLPLGRLTRVQHSFSYSDGFGREIQKKIQAEPEKINGQAGPPRWVGSGWTIFNNKGKPVRRYEPFFSPLLAKGHRFEFGVQAGVSPTLFYDPPGRVIATLHPNHSYEKLVFDPWRQVTWDVNDTVLLHARTDADIAGATAGYFASLPASPPAPAWQTWHAQRQAGALGPHEQAAASKAAAHANTPTIAYCDALGRPFLTLADNGPDPAHPGSPLRFATRTELDIEGKQRAVRDAIEQAGDQLGRIVMRYAYDLLGNRIHQASMEAGARWTINDVSGKAIRAWDSRGHEFVTAYDVLRRPVRQYVHGATTHADPRTRSGAILVDKIEYGEGQANAEALNLRTRIFRHSDSAGIVTNAALNPIGNRIEAYDFKGNLLRSTRQLASDYRAIPDWQMINPGPQLDAELFTGSTRYDALNRPVQSIAPQGNPLRIRRNIIQPEFNEANLLERVHVWLDHDEPAGLLDPEADAPSPVGVRNIDYNAKGQRLRIEYRNGAATRCHYDEETFRLIHLYTRRGGAFTEDCDNPQRNPATMAAPEQPPPNNYCGLQNLHYTYDPAGNITHIQDDAQQPIYFKNQRVEPSNDYTYDALYRLIEATGREHLGQGGVAIPHSYNDAGRVGVKSADASGRFSPNDRSAMGRYTERYVYDAVGNFLEMKHERPGAPAPGWTRSYAYDEASLIEDGTGSALFKTSNRLSRTTVSGNNAVLESYQHDLHGNMTGMPQLQWMQWDYRDRLVTSQRQKVDNEDLDGDKHAGDRTYYVYDANGQRVRKVTELNGGNVIEERIYLGGFEVFRRRGSAIGVGAVTLERETLHVMDDKQRIALVETRTLGNDPAPTQLIRYQIGNHLGSATIELDDQAQIISYEEYTPYGSTAYQAVRSQTETRKRYRYTANERDTESGLCRHGHRYYLAWLGRWTSCDPSGIDDGPNTYCYVRCSPCSRIDPSGKAGEPPQMWLTQQTELRQPCTATVCTRGYGKVLRDAMSALGTQWGWEKTDVGDPENMPFALTPAGTKRSLYAQPSAENQALGRTVVKALVAAARAANLFAREEGVDLTGTKGTKYGQSPLVPKLQDVRRNDPVPVRNAPAAQTLPLGTKAGLSLGASTSSTQLEMALGLSAAPELALAPQPSAAPAKAKAPNSTANAPANGDLYNNLGTAIVPGTAEGLLAVEVVELSAARLGLKTMFEVAGRAKTAAGPAVAGAIVGAYVGSEIEGVALGAGLDAGTGIGIGFFSAVVSGALIGAGVGFVAGGAGAGPGALAGGLAGGMAYMMNRAF